MMNKAAVVMSLCLLGAGCGNNNAAVEALAKRVQLMEDEKQIRDMIVDYGLSLDRKDFSGYSDLFAKEGEWSGQLSGMTTIKGPETIRATMEKNFAERVYDPEHITNLHLVTNVKVTIDGDRATGYSRWTVLSRNEKDEPYVRITGRYDDVLIREDGRWKFLSRVARREVP